MRLHRATCRGLPLVLLLGGCSGLLAPERKPPPPTELKWTTQWFTQPDQPVPAQISAQSPPRPAGRSSGRSSWGDITSSKGVYWTILCMELRGGSSNVDAEQIAESLRSTRGIDPREVRVAHELDRSRIYYGKYLRTPDAETGKFVIPEAMRRDAALIKDLSSNEGGRFFYDSRPVPVPTPDVGREEWKLENNPGTYSLRVAIFFDEPGFYKRKEAAAAYCGELRERGHEAWYRHTEFVSEVFVGSFGPDALVQGRKSGIVVYLNSAEVQQLQAREGGRFQYELWNMKMRTLGSGDSASAVGGRAGGPEAGRIFYLSRLFPVHEEEESDDDFYGY